MQKILLLPVVMAFSFNTTAQLKATPVCPAFLVDILKGRVNNIEPASTTGQVKSAFPCFSGVEEESAGSSCGDVVRFADKGIDFYTSRNYIEIKEKFKGSLSLPLMGAARNTLFKWLGHPKIKDVNWDAFQTAYGTLVLYYNKAGKVNKLQFSNKSTETIRLCE